MPEFTVTISDEELKALEWEIVDVQEWIQNAIDEKGRRVTDVLAQKILEDNGLGQADWQVIQDMMTAQQVPPLAPLKHLPKDIKAEIVKRANIEKAADKSM